MADPLPLLVASGRNEWSWPSGKAAVWHVEVYGCWCAARDENGGELSDLMGDLREFASPAEAAAAIGARLP